MRPVIGEVVEVERRTMREAEERAEADAWSCVVSPARVVGNRAHEKLLAEREQRAARMGQPSRVRRFEKVRG